MVRVYGIALGAPCLALLCALAVSSPGASNPLAIPMFVFAVVLSAWFGGRGPGLVATALGFVGIDYFFEEPMYSLAINSVGTAVDLVVFLVISVLVGTMSERAKKGRSVQAVELTAAQRVAGSAAQTPENLTELPRQQDVAVRIVEPAAPTTWQAALDTVTSSAKDGADDALLQDRALCSPSVESTLVIIKPDGVERALVGEIITRFERRGLRLRLLKMMQADRALIEQHYAHHRREPFFHDVVEYMLGGPVVAMILEGADAIRLVRTLVGSPHPDQATPGTIRGDWAVSRLQTLVHSADTRAAAAREVALWFSPEEADEPCSAVPMQRLARAS